MDDLMIKTAAETLKMNSDEVLQYVKELPEYDAAYFWQPRRGGNSVIVASNGEKLAATSSVCFKRHLEAFLAGKRN